MIGSVSTKFFDLVIIGGKLRMALKVVRLENHTQINMVVKGIPTITILRNAGPTLSLSKGVLRCLTVLT